METEPTEVRGCLLTDAWICSLQERSLPPWLNEHPVEMIHHQAPALCVQAGSTWVCHVGPCAMSPCPESPHLNPKAEVTQLPSCSLHHLKTESLGVGKSFSTTHKDEKCLQFSFFQELPLECDFGRRYFGFFVLHNSRDHKIDPETKGTWG